MKFEVYKDGQIAKEFHLSGEYMFGADSIPLRSANKIKFKNGIIDCKRSNTESAGLTLLWPVEGFGKLLLPTTRLPKRKEPYILNIELARAKLMQITLKREDWSVFGEAGEFGKIGKDAKKLFIEALQNINDRPKAASLADASLKKALEFSEKFAVAYGEKVLLARCKNRSLGRHSLGCQIESDLMISDKYRKRLLETFGFVTIPVNWAKIEKKPGEYDFSSIDQSLKHLTNKRLAIFAGPLVSFTKEALPKWIQKSHGDFEKIREAAYKFVAKTVAHYSGQIHGWRVISGMHALNCLDFNFEQIIEMTRAVCLASRTADSKSRKLVEIVYPWGEYYANIKDSIPPLIYIEMILQSGIAFEGFSVQFKYGKDTPGMHVRDMMQLSAKLDTFSSFGKPVHISGIGIPDSCDENDPDCEDCGCWHDKWSEKVQAAWLDQFYRIVLGKNFVSSVSYGRFADAQKSQLSGSGLMSESLEPKKSLFNLVKLQKLILNKTT